jgi:hypothetical protein
MEKKARKNIEDVIASKEKISPKLVGELKDILREIE